MSPERLAAIQSQGTGVGIGGMRERVRHLRGNLVIESNGSGTKVYATPIEDITLIAREQHPAGCSLKPMGFCGSTGMLVVDSY